MYLMKKIVGTHNGIFHEDDVLAVALLSILYDDNIIIKRSRNPEVLDICDILVDVGGGKYDHHMAGTLKFRDDGSPYASAGLIWKDFGTEILKKLDVTCVNCEELVKNIDEDLIKPVDLKDNGKASDTPFSFIEAYIPLWTDANPNYDAAFKEIVNVTKDIVTNLLLKKIAKQKADAVVLLAINKKEPTSNTVLLPCQNIQWTDLAIMHNFLMEFDNSEEYSNKIVDFVIFPYPDGGYAAQCVPKDLSDLFSKRIPFPEEWCGHAEDLPVISGISDATFCHINGFFARAKTLDAIIKMCEAATDIYWINN